MKFLCLISVLLLSGCAVQNSTPAPSLVAARQGFQTNLTAQSPEKTPVETAPPAIFRTLSFPSVKGQLAAYVSPDPKDGKKHPAMVWITGGDCNSISDVWSPASPSNDQTAAAYRKAGIVMMFPSLRGGNTNPGQKEGFLGEVDDVLAAAKWLEKQPYVDAKRIYLGGHSTGGTLALLVAEASPRFRAAFCFGAVGDVAGYGADSGFLPFDINNSREVEVRSPLRFLASVAAPTWVIEGEPKTAGTSNIESLREMQKATTNPQIHFVGVPGLDHFEVLAPANAVLARKIVADTGPSSHISFTEDDVKASGD